MYNKGNLKKYQTKNKLKYLFVSNFNNKILDIIKLTKGKIVLDAGCGEGFIIELLQNNIKNLNITGLELESEALLAARTRTKENVILEKGNIYDMNYDAQSFDIVLCIEVLEHLENPNKALEELKRVLKNGGCLIVTVPNEPWFCIGNLLSLKNVKRFGNPEDHINHWSFNSFKKFIANDTNINNIEFVKCFPWSIAVIKK